MESHICQVSTNRPSHGLYIGNFLRNGFAAGPDSFAQLTWLPESGFQLNMWSYDPAPIANYPVKTNVIQMDSCLACFINVYPHYLYKGYISFEVNANGVYRCMFGPDSRERKDISIFGVPGPEVEISHGIRDGGACWMVKTIIPKEFVEAAYGFPCKLKAGDKMRGNFYAYSENGKSPYWGSWAPLCRPDLHMTEHFGLLEIV